MKGKQAQTGQTLKINPQKCEKETFLLHSNKFTCISSCFSFSPELMASRMERTSDRMACASCSL